VRVRVKLGSSRVGVSALVCDNLGDAVAGGQGNQLYEALRCPKDYVEFGAKDGAEGHCEAGGQVLFHRVAYDWLDKTLATTS
jgi:hypothetical protein